MTRLGGAFWFILVIAAGMTNFLVKQTVQTLDDQLTQVKRKTAEDQKKIHDLTADWTFLTQPELLSDLNGRYIHLVPISPKQIVGNLDGIAMRPAPAPQEAPPAVAQVSAPAAAPATDAVVALDAPAAASPVVVATAAATLAPAASTPTAPASPANATRSPTPSLSLISTAHAATVTPSAAPAPARSRPAPAAQAPSLDALFAQVAGNR